MCKTGCFHFQTAVWADLVIDPNYPFNSRMRFFYISETHPVQPFILQYAVNPFCYGILTRITVFCHTDLKMIFGQYFHIVLTAVLDPSVRMMENIPGSLGQLTDSHF